MRIATVHNRLDIFENIFSDTSIVFSFPCYNKNIFVMDLGNLKEKGVLGYDYGVLCWQPLYFYWALSAPD